MGRNRGLSYDKAPIASDHVMAANPDLYAPKKKEKSEKDQATDAQVALKRALRESFARTFETVWRRNCDIPIIESKNYHGEPWMLVKEYKFHPTIAYSADYYIKIERNGQEKEWIIELNGGVWKEKGGHTSGKGYIHDCMRNNDATMLGFHVLLIPTGYATDIYVGKIIQSML